LLLICGFPESKFTVILPREHSISYLCRHKPKKYENGKHISEFQFEVDQKVVFVKGLKLLGSYLPVRHPHRVGVIAI
jgi:hypothetical protein